MKIAILDGSSVGEIADHRSLFPKTSFPKAGPNPEWLAANSCAEVVRFLDFNRATQTSAAVTPYLLEGKVYTHRAIDMTAAEQEAVVLADSALSAKHARNARNALLAATDYTAMSDVTMSAGVRLYRQALRDVPTLPGFPKTHELPNKPEGL